MFHPSKGPKIVQVVTKTARLASIQIVTVQLVLYFLTIIVSVKGGEKERRIAQVATKKGERNSTLRE